MISSKKDSVHIVSSQEAKYRSVEIYDHVDKRELWKS